MVQKVSGWECRRHTHFHLCGQNSITGPHLTAREARKRIPAVCPERRNAFDECLASLCHRLPIPFWMTLEDKLLPYINCTGTSIVWEPITKRYPWKKHLETSNADLEPLIDILIWIYLKMSLRSKSVFYMLYTMYVFCCYKITDLSQSEFRNMYTMLYAMTFSFPKWSSGLIFILLSYKIRSHTQY